MDFRIMALSLALWLPASWGSTMKQMDDITPIVYQYPSEALRQITQLEAALRDDTSDSAAIERLRLSAIKCETLLQLGENEAAINLAQLGDAKAKSLHIDEARPYFLSCMADAHANYDDLKIAYPLFDSAITLAKQYQQPQALVNALRQRGQIDTNTNNFTSAIEDLRITLDLYPELMEQQRNWFWPPKAYAFAAMANLLFVTGDVGNAVDYINKALSSSDAVGKVRHNLLLSSAKINIAANRPDVSEQQLKEAKTMLPDLDSALELAYSYATIASVEIDLNRFGNAKELITIATNTFEKYRKVNEVMRSKRLLAQVEFATGNVQAALTLMEDAIQRGLRLNQYGDLTQFYTILSRHYADSSDYQAAYLYITKAYHTSELANKELNDARFIQFRARLGQQISRQAESTRTIESHANTAISRWNIAYMIALGALSMLVLIMITTTFYRRHKKSKTTSTPMDDNRPLSLQLEALLTHAKQGNYALSLLLVNTSSIDPEDAVTLQAMLSAELREHDKIINYSTTEIAILLPHTSTRGAERVMAQLQAKIALWHPEFKLSMGQTSMQQFDTLVSMVKRASINQLSKVRSAEQFNKVIE